MVWTKEKVTQIPEVYRDFMLILKPILDSRRPGAIVRTTGIPFGRIVGLLSAKYDYDATEVRSVADTLHQQGLVNEDLLGFFQPTPTGEGLIAAMTEGTQNSARVPPFPAL